MPKKKAKKIEPISEFKVRIKSLGRWIESVGTSYADALLKAKIPKARGLTVVVLGDKERVLSPLQTQRIFNASPSMREIMINKMLT